MALSAIEERTEDSEGDVVPETQYEATPGLQDHDMEQYLDFDPRDH